MIEYAIVEIQEAREIHRDLPVFAFPEEAQAKDFASKQKGMMVVKEQGKNIWRVMPEFSTPRVLSTMSED